MSNALSFEVKKDGFTQLQSGNYKLTVTVNPADLEGNQQDLLLDFVKAPMGSIYMMAMARVDEDTGEPAQPERRRFEDLPYAQQAGIRCNDAAFINFLQEVYSVEWQNIWYNSEPRVEDPRNPPAVAAQFVRVWCGVESRAQLDTVEEAAQHWRKLDGEFWSWLRNT